MRWLSEKSGSMDVKIRGLSLGFLGFLGFLLQAFCLPSTLIAQGGPPKAGAGETFAFTYEAGDRYRVLSEVQEEVLVNHKFLSRSTIQNRIAFEVAEVSTDGKKGLLRGTFLTEEKPEGSAIPLIQESYDSEFWRDARGNYTIGDNYYMPVVRNCPVFPDGPLKPGDSWTAPGEERHDLRRSFGIPDPYAIPFVARYRYEGIVDQDGKARRLITASYTIFAQPAPPRAFKDIYPIQIAGFSEQRIWWDPEIGEPVSYEERFKLVFDWSDGTQVEYRGNAKASIVEALRMDKAAVQSAVEDAVGDLANVKVTESELGVTISIENIQFLPDSAELRPEEIAKLGKIAAIIAGYPERDILVAGHTALAGTPAGRKKLSEERAATVANALAAAGAASPARFHIVGYGAEKPVADNATVEGMARNRRVEITILEN